MKQPIILLAVLLCVVLAGCNPQATPEPDINQRATLTAAALPTSATPTPREATEAPTPTQESLASEVPPTAESIDPVEAGPSPTPTVEVIFEVDAGLSALEAFDTVQPRVVEAEGLAAWVSLTGNREFGWAITFYDADSGQALVFNVTPEGEVVRSEVVDDSFLTGTAAFDRTGIKIDSDEAVRLAIEHGMKFDAEGSAPLLFLSRGEDGNVVWMVNSTQQAGAVMLDAATGEILSP